MTRRPDPRRPSWDAALIQGGYFCGSYRAGDVRFLLQPARTEPVDLATKERLIQSGQRHYSGLLSRERLPSPEYMRIFQDAFAFARARMAEGLLDLAAIIAERRPGEITLVSLARGGTPIGVVLKHLLERVLGRPTLHYSVSIARDRGIDRNAIRFILDQENRDPAGLTFVDGWTGKGVIARELRGAITGFNRDHGVELDANLFTLTDLAGVGVAPSDRDYLIPSSILNATVSGLISRTLIDDRIGPEDFHGCLFYREFMPRDLSVWFVEALLGATRERLARGHVPRPLAVDPEPGRERSRRLLADLKGRFGIADDNLIKPGIGEATRVLLRRVPERLLIRQPDSPEVAHLLQLARERRVPCDPDPTLPYQAVSLIRGLSHA